MMMMMMVMMMMLLLLLLRPMEMDRNDLQDNGQLDHYHFFWIYLSSWAFAMS